MLNELFGGTDSKDNKNTGLTRTVILTAVARETTKKFISMLEESKEDIDLKNKVKDSLQDYEVLKDLVQPYVDEVDTTELQGMSKEEVKRTIKSQSSARSSTRRKLINNNASFSTYQTYVQAMVAELLIRKEYDLSLNNTVTTYKYDYTEEELAELAKDQHKLRSLIRNAQSRKCIEAKKLDDGETSEKLDLINKSIEQLVSVRTEVQARPNVGVKVRGLIESVDDINKLNKADLIELLSNVRKEVE